MALQKWSKDVVAVVTGGNKGIGYEIVKGLAKSGVTVVLTARDEGRGTAAVKALNNEGFQAVHYHGLSVDSVKSVQSLKSWLEERFGGIDILVNNAGILIDDVSYENASKVLETNLWGVQNVTQGLLTLFKPKGLRRVVMVSSQLGQLSRVASKDLRTRLGDVDNLNFNDIESLAQKYLQDVKAGRTDEWSLSFYQYSESKLLLNAWSRVLAKSLKGEQISVNAICPGFVSTDMTNMNSMARPASEGADTPVWLALLPIDGYPTGKFFVRRKEVNF